MPRTVPDLICSALVVMLSNSIQDRVDAEHGNRAVEQGVSVSRSLSDRHGTDVSGRSCTVLDHHGLAEIARERISEQANDEIRRTARGKGDDDLERSCGERVGSGDIRMAGMRDEIARKQSQLSSIQETVNRDLETAISALGSRESFTLVATGTFGLAVVLVIGAFFVLAFRDRENRFLVNPDVGLQFVTLFSIIIAIILFGVLNILEGKELSALLGGLSGYILGRGSLGSKVGETDGSVK